MSISINAPVPMGVANKLPIGCTQTQDETPYLFRESGGSNNANVGNRLLLNKIVGGTIAWNQYLKESNAAASYTKFGLTFTRISGKFGFAISGTTSYSSGDRNAYIFTGNPQVPITNGHVYFAQCNSEYFNTYLYGASFSNVKLNRVPVGGQIVKATSSSNLSMSLHYGSNIPNNTAIDETVYVNLFDLTAMFGSVIADYAYTLESGTAGAGIAWLKSYGFFAQDYYPYHAATLESVNASAHVMRGANDNIIGNYALDSDLELRGLLKLDANNKLYYDGDEYASDGTVTRKYGIVDLGTLAWNADTNRPGVFYTAGIQSLIKTPSGASASLVCAEYTWRNAGVPSASDLSSNNKQISSYPSYGGWRVYIIDTAYAGTSAADFKTAMSGVYLVYELATPTIETADPYTRLQNVSKDGTEQFVDAGERDIEMPVQHETVYPIPTFAEETFDAFPMSVEESGQTQYPMEVTSQNIIVG